jgi:hypothetical protein
VRRAQFSELDRKFYFMVAKERSEKRERMNEDRKTQLVNLKRGRR